MILTFAEDFSKSVSLDSELLGISTSGMYYNRGVHPLVTVQNLLALLPLESFTFDAYDAGETYSKFETSRKKSDIVTSGGKVYQSVANSNTGNGVDDADYWMETNIESLRLKSFIWTTEDNAVSALSINRNLIENQYIYNVGETDVTLPSDYAAWAFEPKGSDYVKIRINQMALQANTTDPVNVTVINQGTVQTTIALNPNNGILEFEDVGYVITGKGRFIFAFPSQSVKSNTAFVDPLKFKGFVCYPMVGIGSTPQGATYAEGTTGNGLNFNVTAYLDSSVFVTNNKIDLAKFYQAQFEYDFIRHAVYNASVNSNREGRNLSQEKVNLLVQEVLNIDINSVAKKYNEQKQIAMASINNTFDNFLKSPSTGRLKTRYHV